MDGFTQSQWLVTRMRFQTKSLYLINSLQENFEEVIFQTLYKHFADVILI